MFQNNDCEVVFMLRNKFDSMKRTLQLTYFMPTETDEMAKWETLHSRQKQPDSI